MSKFLFFIFINLFSSQLFANDLKLEQNHHWMNKNYDTIIQVISSDDELLVVPIINTLSDLWSQRDGALSGEVSPLVIEALINEPEITLIALSSDSESFKKWLGEIQGMAFTGQSIDDVEYLTEMKKRLNVSLVEYISHGDSNLILYADMLIDKLDEISIRIVD